MPTRKTQRNTSTTHVPNWDERPRPYIKTTPNLADPPFWPKNNKAMTLGEEMHYLSVLAPEKVKAFHLLIDSILREEWWQAARTEDGLAALMRMTTSEE